MTLDFQLTVLKEAKNKFDPNNLFSHISSNSKLRAFPEKQANQCVVNKVVLKIFSAQLKGNLALNDADHGFLSTMLLMREKCNFYKSIVGIYHDGSVSERAFMLGCAFYMHFSRVHTMPHCVHT